MNHKSSKVVDHAKSDQPKAAMIYIRKAENQPLVSVSYSPLE